MGWVSKIFTYQVRCLVTVPYTSVKCTWYELVPGRAGTFRLQAFAPWLQRSWKTIFGRVVLHDRTKKRYIGLFWKMFFLLKEVHLNVFWNFSTTSNQNYGKNRRARYIVLVLWEAFLKTGMYSSRNKASVTDIFPLLMRSCQHVSRRLFDVLADILPKE